MVWQLPISQVYYIRQNQFKLSKMLFPRTSKKLTLQDRYVNIPSFLSPINKYNQRSFSAYSLQIPSSIGNGGNLREEIRLQTFKKNVLTDSKLNKTAMNKATAKCHFQQLSKENELRQQIHQLQKQLSHLKDEKHQLKFLNNDNMMLITRQNQLIKSLQVELSLSAETIAIKKNPCDCYMTEQYVLKIKNLEVKNRHLEKERRELMQEIRQLIIKQEELMAEIRRYQDKFSNQTKYNQKLRTIYHEEKKRKDTSSLAKLTNHDIRRQNAQEQWSSGPSSNINSNSASNQASSRSYIHKSTKKLKKSHEKERISQLKHYYDYINNIRHKQMEKIQDILRT